MKNKHLFQLYILTLGLGFFSFISCQEAAEEKQEDAFSMIEDEAVKSVLEKAILQAGGLEKWQSKKVITFEKYVALYDSSGQTEQENWQTHRYEYQPTNTVKISWEQDSQRYEIRADSHQIQRRIDGKVDQSANPQSLENTVLSSTFVISLPFKLLDKGVELTYKGEQTIEDTAKVKVIQATYNAAAHDNHSNQDIWELYFDVNDYTMLGYKVQHDDHISYVINETFVKENGLLFPHLRKSYRVDENGNKLFLRAAYEYKDYKIGF